MSGPPEIALNSIGFAYPGGEPMHFDTVFAPGSFTGLIGPSGSGKSTLVNLVAGFEEPSEGDIVIDGKSVAGRPPADRPVTMVFQENNLFAHLDAFTNVALGISPGLDLTDRQHETVRQALARTGLADMEKRLPGELSGGQRRRVAIARALVRNRPVLLLDEPFAALGPALRRDMLQLVRAIHAEQQLTTILISHDPEDVRRAATHAAFLNHGRVVANRPVEKLFSGARVEGLAEYLG